MNIKFHSGAELWGLAEDTLSRYLTIIRWRWYICYIDHPGERGRNRGRERERERVRVCVYVSERERKRERECVRERRVCMWGKKCNLGQPWDVEIKNIQYKYLYTYSIAGNIRLERNFAIFTLYSHSYLTDYLSPMSIIIGRTDKSWFHWLFLQCKGKGT